MKIAFLSSLDPTDIHNWSGTLFHMYRNLSETHQLEWIGGKLIKEVIKFHVNNNQAASPFISEQYAHLYGKLLSDLFSYKWYDLIICRDYYFLSYLITDIPIFYIGDTTFKLLNQWFKMKDLAFYELADNLERRAIQNASHLVYSSEWAKNSAINDYGADPSKITVIEFGANIVKVPNFKLKSSISICNLLFLGREWDRKGGNMVVEIYNELRLKGVSCTLTIIGCSKSSLKVQDINIRVFPYIDKASSEGEMLFEKLLSNSHFLLAPSLFECFGILYCEAAAYGIPTLTSDVCGVSQVIRDGENGYLFPVDSRAGDYVARILSLLSDQSKYNQMQEYSRKHYEDRLNWQKWCLRMNLLFKEIISSKKEFFLPVYVNIFRQEEGVKHIEKEFKDKTEFEVHIIETYIHRDNAKELWNNIVKIVQIAKSRQEDIIIICEDSHYFTEEYSYGLLIKEICESYAQGAEVLSGGIKKFDMALPAGFHRYWVKCFWGTQFIVIYNSLFDKILDYDFKGNDTVENVLSVLACRKLVIYPFISEQYDFKNFPPINNKNNQNKTQTDSSTAKSRLKCMENFLTLNENSYSESM